VQLYDHIMKRLFFSLLLSLSASIGMAADKLVLQVGTPAPNMLHLPVYVSQKAGYFAEENLEIELRHSPNASVAAQIVSSGGADLAEFSFEPALLGHDKGIRGKFFYRTTPRLIYFVGVLPGSNISNIKELAGKSIGVSNMGSASIFILRSMLRDSGLADDQIRLVPVGVGDSAAAALRSGQVQALSLWDSAYAGLERGGLKFDYIAHPTLKSVGNNGYFVREASQVESREKLVRFSRAITKAFALIDSEPVNAVKFYWQANPAGKTGADEKDALEKSISELKFIFQTPGRPTERNGRFSYPDVQRYLDEMKKVDLYKGDLKAADIADDTIWSESSSPAKPRK